MLLDAGADPTFTDEMQQTVAMRLMFGDPNQDPGDRWRTRGQFVQHATEERKGYFSAPMILDCICSAILRRPVAGKKKSKKQTAEWTKGHDCSDNGSGTSSSGPRTGRSTSGLDGDGSHISDAGTEMEKEEGCERQPQKKQRIQ
jgi:hypothetical protein